MVRAAIAHKERLEDDGRTAGPITNRLVSLAPARLVLPPHRVPVPVEVPARGQPAGLRLPPMEQGDLVAAFDGRVQEGPPDEPRPADDQDPHAVSAS